MSKRGREAKSHLIGQVGRLTGQPMPTNVPRDEDGLEDVDVFFDSSPGAPSKGKQPARAGSNKPAANAAPTRGARPDVYNDPGRVGRKTGQVYGDNIRRLTNGLEDPDAFFMSPNSTRPLASTSAASAKRKPTSADKSVELGRRADGRRLTDARPRSEEQESEEDMSLEQASGLSPDRYLTQPQSRSPASRRTSYQSAPPSSGSRSRAPDNLAPFGSPRAQSRRKRTPTPVSEEEEQQPSEEEASPPAPTRRDKGKARALPSEDEQENSVEQEDSRVRDDSHDFLPDNDDRGGDYLDETSAMMDVDPEQPDEDVSVEAALIDRSDSDSSPPRRKPLSPVRGSNGKVKRPRATPSKSPSQKTVRIKPPRKDFSAEPDGVRRSARPTQKPLAYWRNEKAVYKRRQSGLTLVEVIRTEDEPQHMPQQIRKKGHKRGRSASTPAVKEDPERENFDREMQEQQYDGWDDGTDADGLTWDFLEKREKRRRIAFPKRLIAPELVAKGAYRFQKIFSDGEYMACGILEIPVQSKKPIKAAKDNSYMLYVERGVVQVLVYRTTFPISQGGFFFVPRGNTYEIENIGDDPCRLVFAQAREVKIATAEDMMDEEEEGAYGPMDGMEGDASRYQPAELDTVEEEEEPESE